MNLFRKFFTLIELIVVIVVLGILAAIVIPNISSFKEEAEYTSIVSNTKNLQTSVDMFVLEHNGATPTKEKATLGNPQILEIYGLHPEHTRDIPKNKGIKWWLDYSNTVWASYVDAPTEVSNDGSQLKWKSVDNVVLYKIYKGTGSGLNASVKNKEISFVQDVTPIGDVDGFQVVEGLSILPSGSYLVSAVDQFGFESAPVKSNTTYKGYGEGPSKEFMVGVPSVEESNGPKPLLKTAPEGWTEIHSVSELAKIGVDIQYPLNGKYILMKNLDLNISPYNEGTGWKPIGEFKGEFDGNGLVIDNLYINTISRYAGLFSRTNKDIQFAVIKNLTITNANVTGDSSVGILVGYNGFTNVENVKVQGTVKGRLNVGGLLGQNWDSSTVKHSSADVNVLGNHNVGGLIGENIGGYVDNSYSTGYVESTQYNAGGFIGHLSWNRAVQNSYSTATVKGVQNVGGFVGMFWSSAVIRNSYSTGLTTGNINVGGFVGDNSNNTILSNSYWDTTTSKLTTSKGGIGKTSNELANLATYSGWDFNTIWELNEGSNYPTLK